MKDKVRQIDSNFKLFNVRDFDVLSSRMTSRFNLNLLEILHQVLLQ